MGELLTIVLQFGSQFRANNRLKINDFRYATSANSARNLAAVSEIGQFASESRDQPRDEVRLFAYPDRGARTQIEESHRRAGYKGALLFEAQRYEQAGSLVELARDYSQAGVSLKALALLEETARRGWPGLERLKVDPDFDPLPR